MSRNGEIKPGDDTTWNLEPIEAWVDSYAKNYWCPKEWQGYETYSWKNRSRQKQIVSERMIKA
jgi:hypothetical protein